MTDGAGSAKATLRRVEGIIGARDRVHGDPIRQHRGLAELWSAYLNKPVTATDVAVMMALMKISRILNTLHPDQDTFDDLVGYAAIAAACSDAARDTGSEITHTGRSLG